MNNNLLLFTFLAIVVLGCQSSTQSIPQMEFKLNPEFLEASVIRDASFKVQYQVPKDWALVDTLSEAVLEQVSSKIDQYDLKIKQVYFNGSLGCFLIVSDLSDFKLEEGEQLQLKVEATLEASKRWSAPQYTQFQYNDFIVDQFLLQDGSLVNFKLIFYQDRPQPFQFDYILSRENYDRNLAQAVESSIGSIRIIK